MTVAITRKEPGAVELRREAARCRDARAARRMLALALVLEGASREEAARAAGMDRQTLRDWVHRYNAEGLPGLHDRHRSGRKPRLIPAALIDDRLRPLAAGDRGEPVGRRQQPVPGVAAGGDDGLVVRLCFVAGGPVSIVTCAFLAWVAERLAAEGVRVLVLIWDNAGWHVI